MQQEGSHTDPKIKRKGPDPDQGLFYDPINEKTQISLIYIAIQTQNSEFMDRKIPIKTQIMSLAKNVARHIRGIHFGGNWTVTNLKDTLSDVRVEEALTQVHDFNTIATLSYHMYYFIEVVLKVLKGGPLEGNDKLSFDHPPFTSQEDWEAFLQKFWKDAEEFAALTEELDDKIFEAEFKDPKYGNYYANLAGIIEHSHYHLGQITLLKKLIRKT